MNKVFYFLALVPFLYIPITAFGGEYYVCSPGFSTFFDNPVFNKTGTVPIKIYSNCGVTDTNVSVIVSDGSSADMHNKIFEQNVVVNQSPIEVDFKIPNNATTDRFMITIMDQNGTIYNRWMIFTNEAASHILISDVKIPQSVKAGNPIPISANITDGLGRPIPLLSATAAIEYPDCDGSDLSPISAPMSRNSSEYTALINTGSDTLPSTFPLRISINKPQWYYPLYWQPAWTGKVTIEPSNNTTIQNSTIPLEVGHLFHRMYDWSSIGPYYNGRNYAPGDDIVIKGQTATDGCGQPIPDVDITGEFIGMPAPVIKAHTTSDSNGNFQIHFQTFPQLPMDADPINGGVYSIELKAKYNGKDYSWNSNDEIMLYDIKRFTFNIENKSSTASVLVNYGYQVDSLTLDKESKSLSFAGDATNDQGTFLIAIPHDLIGGDFVVEKDGKQIAMMSSDDNSGSGDKISLYGTDSGYTMVQYSPGQAEKVNLKIIGTTVIPEFHLAVPILFVGITSLVVLHRLKIQK